MMWEAIGAIAAVVSVVLFVWVERDRFGVNSIGRRRFRLRSVGRHSSQLPQLPKSFENVDKLSEIVCVLEMMQGGFSVWQIGALKVYGGSGRWDTLSIHAGTLVGVSDAVHRQRLHFLGWRGHAAGIYSQSWYRKKRLGILSILNKFFFRKVAKEIYLVNMVFGVSDIEVRGLSR
jgi:hypothetical protein